MIDNPFSAARRKIGTAVVLHTRAHTARRGVIVGGFQDLRFSL